MSGADAELLALVGRVYKAASRRDRWRAVPEQLSELLHAVEAVFFVRSVDHGFATFSQG